MAVFPTAGTIPYIKHWDQLIAYHPVFSLSTYKLFEFARSEWKRLAQRASDEEISQAESNILCVTYLAILHSLGSITQDEPALPPLKVVQATFNELAAIAAWKFYLDSKLMRMPQLHICKRNLNLDFSNMSDYLAVCWEAKKAYESKVREREEEEKLRTAAKAMEALSREWVTPTNKKVLWAWIQAHLLDKYKDDATWMKSLFLGTTSTISVFDDDEIELLEEIIIDSCPLGTGVMHAIRARLQEIKQIWDRERNTFQIELADYGTSKLLINGQRQLVSDPGEIPILANFANKIQHAIAVAKWKIAKAAWDKQQTAGPSSPNSQLEEL